MAELMVAPERLIRHDALKPLDGLISLERTCVASPSTLQKIPDGLHATAVAMADVPDQRHPTAVARRQGVAKRHQLTEGRHNVPCIPCYRTGRPKGPISVLKRPAPTSKVP